jgi:hypothetical protein
VPHLLWHGTSVFPVSSEGPPHLVASYDTRGDVEDPHGLAVFKFCKKITCFASYLDWLFTVLRPAQELFTYMET